MPSVKCTVQLINQLGLHARASVKLVAVASRYLSEIKITHKQKIANAKSFMALLLLSAAVGSQLEITAEGEDAEEAIEAIKALIANRFGEEK